MSFKLSYPQQQQYRQSLTFEDMLKSQIVKCNDAFSINDQQGSAATVRTLVNMVTRKMRDKTYAEEMTQLDLDEKGEAKQRQKEYKKRTKLAACPDVVNKPSDLPGQQYWEDAFAICLDLFERKGLLLKLSNEETLG